MSTSRFPPATNDANEAGTYIVKTATDKPPNAQVLASLSTGLATVTTTTGVVSTDSALTWNATTKQLSALGSVTKASAAGATWDALTLPAATLTLTGITQVTTATGVNLMSLAAPTITDASVVTVDTGATLYIGGPPAAAGSVTLTTPLALWVDNGIVQFDGTVKVGPTVTPAVPSASLQVYGASNAFLIVRDTSNAVEMSIGNASTTGVIGTQTNHSMNLITNNTARLSLSSGLATFAASTSVVIGTAALATNATDGFLYIPTCAGTPTGTPTTRTGTVAMIFDTTNHKLYIFDTSWKGGTAPGVWT